MDSLILGTKSEFLLFCGRSDVTYTGLSPNILPRVQTSKGGDWIRDYMGPVELICKTQPFLLK